MRGLLALSPEEMREYGYRVIDLLVEHHAALGEKRVAAKLDPVLMEQRLREPAPAAATPFPQVLERLRAEVLSNIACVNHPRFFAFVPSPGNFAGVMADAIASGFNVFEGTWFAGSGPAAIELTVLEWMRQWFGLPSGTAGIFVSGGSMANLTAVAVALRAQLVGDPAAAVAYFSDQTHSSVERAFRVAGIGCQGIRKLPADDQFRLPMSELRRAVKSDRASGLRPFCVVANAGTTNTGAVDPFRELAEFCQEEGLWLHADGAYGAAAVLCDRGRQELDGLELVDSLTLDPHKWLFQPIACGCLLVRQGSLLKDTFRITPEYLQDVHQRHQEENFCDRGIELTRGFRALKLWMSIQVFGMDAFRQAVARGIELAEIAERRLRASGHWEITTPARLATVTFRHVSSDRDLVTEMYADGYALLTSTLLQGRRVLRMCTLNPRTTDEEIDSTIDRLERLAG